VLGVMVAGTAQWPAERPGTGSAVARILLPWDGAGTASGLPPEWAEKLSQSCRRYTLTTTQVTKARSVVAMKAGEGPGPHLTR
jgi:hypothetical protein